MNLQTAIKNLQTAISTHFPKLDTRSGAATLSISADRIELTNESCDIQARGPAQVVRVLRRKRIRKPHPSH